MSVLSGSAKPIASGGKALPPELQKAMSKVTELGSLPEVATKIVAVVEDPRATAKEIHDVVQTDPALATKILKIVNSAFYGLPSQIASLERAMLMLGMSSIRNLALAASLSRLLKDGPVSQQFSTRDLWRHSVAVGVCAKLLARAGRCAQGDEAFVAGLVHDMGLIVSQQLFRTKMKEVAERCFSAPQDFCLVEESVIGADHQAFGGALAAKWKFPPGLRHTVAYHHEPSLLQPEFQKVAALVYVADALCCQARLGFWLTGQMQQPTAAMLKLIGLGTDDVERVAQELPERLAEAEQIFAPG